MIYFHGNSEDIGHSYDLINKVRHGLEINVLSVGKIFFK